MPDLRTELERCLRGRVCFVGLGNTARGDDGLGMCLAEALRQGLGPGEPAVEGAASGLCGSPACGVFDGGAHRVVLAGTALERWGTEWARPEFDRVVFLDAVDFGGSPGSVALFEAEEIRARFPQVSTHRLSLGLWAQWLEADGARRVWLLGVKPASLRAGSRLSVPVAAAVSLLARWIEELLGTEFQRGRSGVAVERIGGACAC